MKKLSVILFSVFLAAAAEANSQMKEMERHMEEHMGRGMEGGQPGMQAAQGLTEEKAEAGVTAKVTYANPGEAMPVFNVVLDTHTAGLDGYRFGEIVELRDDAGREYEPVVVSEKGSGHHREATVEFRDAALFGGRYIELVIEGVAGVEERVFRFDLKGDAPVKRSL